MENGTENEILKLTRSILMLENSESSSFLSDEERNSHVKMRITKTETLIQKLQLKLGEANNKIKFIHEPFN